MRRGGGCSLHQIHSGVLRCVLAAGVCASPLLLERHAIAQEAAQPAPNGNVNGNGSGKICFNFKGATYQQVVEFFSRVTNLPVIWQTVPPEGVLDYISPPDTKYDQAEALRVLNMILQSKGVMLRVSHHNLYLQKLDQMQREDIPTFIESIPADITPDQIVTLVRPLKIALAKPLSERLGALVASYGAVTAMEQQNTLVITESAANVRRILSIIETLDQSDPDGAVEIFSIKNARAVELMVPLKSLMSQKVEKFVINQQGQQVKIEEDQMPGLSISADERTNAIIAKGVQNKIEKLREAIDLLDVPASSGVGQGRSMTTIALQRLTPAEVAGKLNQLYQRIAEKDRPTVVGLDDASKVMIIGSDAAITEGSLLISELENGPIASNGGANETMMTVLPLRHAAPGGVIAAINSLLTKRQQLCVKVIAGVDGKSIIVSGASAEVNAVKQLIPSLDRASAADRQVRVLRIAPPGGAEPLAIVEQAKVAFAAAMPDVPIESLTSSSPSPRSSEDDSGADALLLDLNAESRSLTMVGTVKAMDAFSNTLRQIEANVVVDRESRRIVLASSVPSEMAGTLSAIAPQLLWPSDGTPYVAPSFAPVDAIHSLIITATPKQHETLAPLIESLDVSMSAASRPVHVLTIENADAHVLAANLDALFNGPGQPLPKPTIRVDAASNSLLVRASDSQLQTIQDIATKIDKATIASTRQMRLVTIDPSKADAAEVAATVQRLLNQNSSDPNKVQVISLDDLVKLREGLQGKSAENAEVPE